MAKVSVIVPIYNVSRFIKRCVESLFNQTLDDVEFIFVNDCTPDDSIDILKKVRQSQKASATLQQIFEKLILRSGEV